MDREKEIAAPWRARARTRSNNGAPLVVRGDQQHGLGEPGVTQLLVDQRRKLQVEVILVGAARALGARIAGRMPDIDDDAEGVAVAGRLAGRLGLGGGRRGRLLGRLGFGRAVAVGLPAVSSWPAPSRSARPRPARPAHNTSASASSESVRARGRVMKRANGMKSPPPKPPGPSGPEFGTAEWATPVALWWRAVGNLRAGGGTW